MPPLEMGPTLSWLLDLPSLRLFSIFDNFVLLDRNYSGSVFDGGIATSSLYKIPYLSSEGIFYKFSLIIVGHFI